jgi:cellulose synthase/poly-beta-1,6-N-acetylglucosamine synthase-like glycosyltransferase
VEDLKLGLDLASTGQAPLFCPTAIVTSTFPQTTEGSKSQRQRWEHGHIGQIASRFVPLLVQSLLRRDISLLALALDLLVPPLSLLIVVLVFMAVMTGILGCFGVSLFPFAIVTGSLALVVLGAAMARFKFARDILPLRTLGLVPLYMLAKLRQYFSALADRKVSRWVRADRG